MNANGINNKILNQLLRKVKRHALSQLFIFYFCQETNEIYIFLSCNLFFYLLNLQNQIKQQEI